jgi:aldose 1-epimerase
LDFSNLPEQQTISLVLGATLLELAPQIGGGIARLRWRGHDILRAASKQSIEARDPTGLAEFPLVPFANRIAGGKIPSAGVQLAPNTPGEVNALHGVGWQRPWQIVEADQTPTNEVALQLNHRADSFWPWDFTATRRFVLTEDTLAVSLSIANNSLRPMPASLGFHPYFPRADCLVKASTKGRVEVNSTGIPTGVVSLRYVEGLASGLDPSANILDHCFTQWDGKARLSYPSYTVEIAAEGCSFLHLYSPLETDVVCVEPVSAMPDAFNQTNEIHVGSMWLPPDPNQCLSISMLIAISQSD